MTSPIGPAILSIDPGSSKCGVAILDTRTLAVIHRAIVPTQELVVEVGKLLRANREVAAIIIGSGTKSRVLLHALQEAYPSIEPTVVDEYASSQRARARYCSETPAKGWRKLLPAGMRSPEEPYDDWVAVILAEDYLTRRSASDPPIK